MPKKKLISIKEAAALGVTRLRRPIWANKMDHIKIDITIGGPLGPWIHLYAPFNKQCNGRDPVDIIILGFDTSIPEYEVYDGPLPESREYKDAVASFAKIISNE